MHASRRAIGWGRTMAVGLAATLGVTVPALSAAPAGATTPPSPPFNECPAVGNDASCAILIVVNADNTVSVLADGTQGPYDGIEDTMVGVLNNSSEPLPSLQLSSGTDIFGFDGDGICTFAPFTGSSYCSAADQSGTDPGDYAGPDNVLTPTNSQSGTVTFNDTPAGLPAGGTSFFSLEESLNPEDITLPPATSLTFTKASPTTSDFNDPVTVAATLLDAAGAPLPGASVTFTLGSGSGAPTCTGTTDSSGDVSCGLTPNEKAGTVTLSAAYLGNATNLGSAATAPFTVTLEQDALTYTGPTTGTNGSALTLSGKLTTDDPSSATAVNGRSVTLTLGSGSSAQSCSGTTDATGSASCTIASVSQTVGSVPVAAAFTSDGFYQDAAATGAVSIAAGPATAPAAPTTTTTAPVPIVAATTIHTGAPWAGSKPVEAVIAALGLGLMGVGLRRRRQLRAFLRSR